VWVLVGVEGYEEGVEVGVEGDVEDVLFDG